jgi:NADH dehydrogenase
MNAAAGSLPPIVVVGAGFAGRNVGRKIPSHWARITVIDRENHRLFQPLPDQVATVGLSARDIAQPVRARCGARPNLTVWLGAVTGFDLAKRVVGVRARRDER